ncbi:MAG: hypothetical protein GC152_00060 [Alphaproteobacteria bacterium]|nr:hypothetical protein [Alphaproteobacteria bacterium]
MAVARVPARIIAAAVLVPLFAACSRAPDVDREPLEPELETGETAPAFVGVWAAEEGWCDAEPGADDPGPIEITTEEVVGYESRCTIVGLEEGTEGGWRLTLACLGEGVVYDEYADLDVDGEMLRMTRGDNPETSFVRCVSE